MLLTQNTHTHTHSPKRPKGALEDAGHVHYHDGGDDGITDIYQIYQIIQLNTCSYVNFILVNLFLTNETSKYRKLVDKGVRVKVRVRERKALYAIFLPY